MADQVPWRLQDPGHQVPRATGAGTRRSSQRAWGALLAGVAVALVVTLSVAGHQAVGAVQLPLRIVTDIPLAGGSSRLDYESLDDRRGLLFVAHLGASIISVVDIRSNHVVATIPDVAGVHGVLALPSLGRVYASTTDNNQVAVIDEHTLRVTARIPASGYPDGLAYDPRDQKVFVSDEGGGTDTVIDTRTNRRVATIPLGGEAGNTQYDAVGHRVLVAVQTLNQLVTIDPVSARVVARFTLPGCTHDHGLLLDAAVRLAFVACDGNARLLVVDLRAMRVTAVQTVGANPDVLALDTSAHRLYVAAESGIVSVFDEQGRTVRKIAEGFVATEAHVIAVDPRTHRLYLPLQDVGGTPVLRVALLLSAGAGH